MKLAVVLWLMLFGAVHTNAQSKELSATDSTTIKQLFFAGLRDKLNDDYIRENISFSKIVALDPNNDAAYYELALLKYRLDRIPEAEIDIKKAISLNKTNPWYLKLLAELYKRNGNMKALVPVFDQLIVLLPEEQSYYFDRSNALLIAGKKQEAMQGYQLIEQKFGSSTALNQARSRINDDSTSSPAVNQQTENTEPLAIATAYIGKKDFANAAKILAGIADARQEDPLFLALYGDVLFETGDLPAALTAYKKALKLTDQLYGVWEKVLNIQILLGQYKEMIVMGDAALAIYPNQAILNYYMAFALHREVQNNAALTYIKTALQLDGENKALQALIFALQAEILIDEHKLTAADVSFNKALELDPQNYLIMNNYAYYLALRNEQMDRAESLIATAAKALPEDASVADTYAFVLFKRAKYKNAKVWIERALKNNAVDNSVYLEHYGDILFFLGEQQQAMIQWQNSLDAGNGSPLLKRKINEKKYIK